ncbi:transposase [Bacillus sp. FJAT-49736]|uniref:transposase n=1 Tax=Bacillus sp. FJAT-49736 TaxID=2833582 RepID=UPI001BC9682A|nr:transposase [Bacillus sp. FJAT-49736]MBS4175097.1 transposase [Bacillus sp. FJAT-49736]
MRFLIILLSIIIPIAMYALQLKWAALRFLYNILALICSLVFGNISALAILEVIRNNTVFMTTIHGIFLNVPFIITGAYLGVYVLYQLLNVTNAQRK